MVTLGSQPPSHGKDTIAYMRGCSGMCVQTTEEVVSVTGIQQKMTSFSPGTTRAVVGGKSFPGEGSQLILEE